MQERKRIKPIPVKAFSGFSPKAGDISTLKRNHYFIEDRRSISGEAPKHFIRVYEYGECKKENTKTWPLYIAKLGHKWYPVESITEYLLNRIGEVIGFNMAKSRLVWTGQQIRFLSRYFLANEKEQELVHGADIYAGYLNDKSFVKEIEEKRKEQEFFTVQFTYEALFHLFPNEADALINEFVKLLVFDGFIGLMDRHIYNWGVIRNLKQKHNLVFSPIYDTARGLFWNESEEKILREARNLKTVDSFIKNYADKCTPKIGWEGKKNINHFQLIELLGKDALGMKPKNILELCSEHNIGIIFSLLDTEFKNILSTERIFLIKKCLEYRQKHICEILK